MRIVIPQKLFSSYPLASDIGVVVCLTARKAVKITENLSFCSIFGPKNSIPFAKTLHKIRGVIPEPTIQLRLIFELLATQARDHHKI